ncbi:aspartic peptidase domain-containing protein [Blyttiomyces helicus]|uniref:Aspartic peptidase domain-containing protein n=1 Tax=Blyttiomyces helicus TaxID=388810 RepID=A0A4P9WD77_9FUNG|nr:aspartic peptidase domain-containing protein [Blyttiomyces helicus]|eukprot:RKO90484.1 aspartic peptidase domain-containing protein [Blyttiomyces helicus]
MSNANSTARCNQPTRRAMHMVALLYPVGSLISPCPAAPDFSTPCNWLATFKRRRPELRSHHPPPQPHPLPTMKNALVLSAIAATASASPLVHKGTTFSAAPHPVSVPIARHTSDASHAARAKANLDVAHARFSKGSSGNVKRSLPLTNVGNQFYYTTVTVGNGQSFKVDLDTGSCDLWVPGPKCSSSDGSCTAGGKPISLIDKSVHSAGVTFSDSYGSGSASGNVYYGPYTLAGATAKKGYFGVTTSEAGFDFQAQGLLGLSFSFGSAIPNGVTSSVGEVPIVALGLKSFGFYLSNAANGDEGTFTTNGYDASHVSGHFSYEAINTSPGYWSFDVSNGQYAIGGTTGDLSDGGSVTNAIADTGTTLLILPTDVASAIWQATGASDQGTGTASIDCSVAQTGPDVSFTFSHTAYAVPASDYVLSNGDGTCISGFSGGAENNGVSIFGDIFLRSWYSFYDIANTRIGFAKAIHA